MCYSGRPARRSPARNRSRSVWRRNGRVKRGSVRVKPGSSRTKPSSPARAYAMRPRCAAAAVNVPCESGNDGLK